jgi:hypothetical protein
MDCIEAGEFGVDDIANIRVQVNGIDHANARSLDDPPNSLTDVANAVSEALAPMACHQNQVGSWRQSRKSQMGWNPGTYSL